MSQPSETPNLNKSLQPTTMVTLSIKDKIDKIENNSKSPGKKIVLKTKKGGKVPYVKRLVPKKEDN